MRTISREILYKIVYMGKVLDNKKNRSKERQTYGRNGWIRTTDLCDPNAAFYQAELRSDVQRQYIYTKKNKITSFF